MRNYRRYPEQYWKSFQEENPFHNTAHTTYLLPRFLFLSEKRNTFIIIIISTV